MPRLALLLAVLFAACSDPAPVPPTWQIAQEGIEGSILSFWGSSSTDVFAVGGVLPDTATPAGIATVLHRDATGWSDISPAGVPALWWVHGFSSTDVWCVGAQGTIVHYDGVNWQTMETGFDYTLWGVWGVAPDDLWTVGGRVDFSGPSVLRHYDGTAWSDVAGGAIDLEIFFKVWGTAAADIFVVGTGGNILHNDGTGFSPMVTGTTDRFLTVRGRSSTDVYVVGGLSNALVMHYDGNTWSPIAADFIPALMGVWTAPGEPVIVTGWNGTLMMDVGAGLRILEPPITARNLHGAWGDGRGYYLAGGGSLFGGDTGTGVILEAGTP